MIDRAQYKPGPAILAEQFEFWSDHVEALERHLSAKRWALSAVTVVLIAYPIARLAIATGFHNILPDVVRNVINLI